MIYLLTILCVLCFTISVICVIFGYVWFFFSYIPSLDKNNESVCHSTLNTDDDLDSGYFGIDCYEDYTREYGGYGHY